jgi:hypothetical protein
VIDITRDVAAGTAVNRPLRVYSKEVFAFSALELFVRNTRAGVFDNSCALGNWFHREQAQACPGAFDSVSVIP